MIKRIVSYPERWFERRKYCRLFRHFGVQSRVFKPLRLYCPENISIGENTYINNMAWLSAVPLTGSEKCSLSIGNGCRVGDFCHLFATESVVIEDNVLIANNVYISDNLHQYSDIDLPIYQQPIVQLAPVVVGEGSWLGEHVCVIGASVGKHSVIGANAVVTKDIPDYCVAVGIPAHVIKRYDFRKQAWRKVDIEGNFIVEEND